VAVVYVARPLPRTWLTCASADFQVTQPLPNVSFPLARNWAGNIAVDRVGFPNDTLFFWAWERENGSLTAGAGDRSGEPWGIWLNGG
jgi:carboxypeptidase D